MIYYNDIKLNNDYNEYVNIERTLIQRDFNYLTKRIRKHDGWHKVQYLDCICCFDSETSKDEKLDVAWVYQWCMCIDKNYYAGRTITQFLDFLEEIEKMYNLNDDCKMIIYVHNLSYDIVYMLRMMYERDINVEPFLLDSRKILTVRYKSFEFRDSYKLSNMSLEKWATSLKTRTTKAVGTIDYETKRFQDEELSYNDWFYQINDVETMRECIEISLQRENDTLLTIPLTSTGYVRRDCRKAVSHDKSYHDWFQKTKLDANMYKLCNIAFAGGYTHANRRILNRTVTSRIGHYDKKSFYPSTQILKYFPVGKFELVYKYQAKNELKPFTIEHFKRQLETKCCLVKIAIKDAVLHDNVTAPYLQRSKLFGKISHEKIDNGRVLEFKGIATAVFTELDIETIQRQYFCEIFVLEFYQSSRGEFPEKLKAIINEYFEKKETLEKNDYFYMKSKNKLNSIYGMSVSRLVRDVIEYDFESATYTRNKIDSFDKVQEILDKYYNSRNSFFPYQLGVWVTAHCRNELLKIIEEIGYENYLYSDTDSVFFIETEKNLKFIEEHNRQIIEECEMKKSYVINRDGVKSYYNLFEDEADDIIKFRTLHSKCYAFENSKGEMLVTIAGISKDNKRTGKERITIADELGTIDNLKDDFTFFECGGTVTKYISHEKENVIIDNHLTEISDACLIIKHEKTISKLEDYEEIYDYGKGE